MATVSSPTQVRRVPNATANANPYQTPAGIRSDRNSLSEAASVPALYSDRVIGVTSFLGGVVAGAILSARNFFLLGRTADAILFLLAAIVWQAFLIGVALAFPLELPSGVSMGLAFGHAFLMQFIARRSFAEQYAAIAAGRGRWGHWSLAIVAVAVPYVMIVSAVVFVTVMFE